MSRRGVTNRLTEDFEASLLGGLADEKQRGDSLLSKTFSKDKKSGSLLAGLRKVSAQSPYSGASKTDKNLHNAMMTSICRKREELIRFGEMEIGVFA